MIGFRKFWYMTMTSFFVLIVLIKPDTHTLRHRCMIDCMRIIMRMIMRTCERTLKVNGLLALFGLDLSFREWFSTIKRLDVKYLQISVTRSWRCDPLLRLVCPSSYVTTLFRVQVHRNTSDPVGIALHIRSPLLRFRDMFALCLVSYVQCR